MQATQGQHHGKIALKPRQPKQDTQDVQRLHATASSLQHCSARLCPPLLVPPATGAAPLSLYPGMPEPDCIGGVVGWDGGEYTGGDVGDGEGGRGDGEGAGVQHVLPLYGGAEGQPA